MDTEKIVALRVSARNNFTLSSEQDMTVWEYDGEITQADVAVGLDTARREAVERNGCSGMGAGARLLAKLGTDDEDEEEIRSMIHPLVAALPVLADGKMQLLRKTIKLGRKPDVWNGNNHVAVPATNCEDLIDRIRHQ